MNTFKLPGQQIPQPPLQQRSDPPHEEQPDSPARSPEATTWTLAHRPLSKKKKETKKTVWTLNKISSVHKQLADKIHCLLTVLNR